MNAAVLRQENAELRAIVDILKGVTSADDLQVIRQPAWALGLSPQQRVLIGILIKAYPHAADRWDILDRLPCLDHVDEREPQQVNVIVYRLRKLFGRDAIETVGSGYRLSEALRERLLAAG